MQKKRIILAAGGTGGHLFPAQAVASSLSESCEVLFVGGGLGGNPYFNRALFSFREVSCVTFAFRKPWQVIGRLPKLCRGIAQSRRILTEFAPDAVIGFGSFFSLPLLTAAQLKGVPIFLHEQNAIPGKVNRLFSRFAQATGITFPHSSSYLHGHAVEVAFPLHHTVEHDIEPYAYFGLENERRTLLVFGGSQGGEGLNRLFLETAPHLTFPFQVLHFTGNSQVTQEAKQCYRALGIPHVVKEFETRMDLAWKIAKIAITRAGAGTIAELMAFETPAIVIPFPFATEEHQAKNGEYFAHVVGGGALLQERETTAEELSKILHTYVEEKMALLQSNVQKYKEEKKLLSFPQLITDFLNRL